MKFNVSKQTQKKSYFPGNVPCSTTLNFFQPSLIFAHEMVPGTTFHAKMRQFCRTSVLNLPTWGDYKILTKSVFVPFGDVYKPWDSFRSRTSYYGTSTFVPSKVPSVLNGTLLNALVNTVGYGSTNHLSVLSFYDGSGTLLVPNPTELEQLKIAVQESYNISPDWASDYDVTVQPYSAKRISKDLYLGVLLGSSVPERFSLASVYISFSEQAKYIHKILVALGLDFMAVNDTSSALPLMCYVKAVYDLFSPNRTDSTNDPFESTPLYGLMYKCMGSDNIVLSLSEVKSLFGMLLDETYYVDNDFMSLFKKNIVVTNEESFNIARPKFAEMQVGHLSNISDTDDSQQNFLNNSVVTSDRLKSIFRIGSLLKANTLIGGKLREFIRSRFGASLSDPHELFEISSSLMDLDISDIFSTASTEQSVLGEYGGRALGTSKDTIKFSTDKNGMFFVISVALQNRYYADTLLPSNRRLTVTDFYSPAYDSLGYEIIPYSYFKTHVDSLTTQDSNSFAYIPRYSDYKFFKPVVSGDFARYALKSSILGFVGNAYKTMDSATRLVFTMQMNKPAFYPLLTNTNHIFYESETPVERSLGDSSSVDAIYPAISDPLILHTYIKIDMHAPMIGRSDVFETVEGDNPTISVEQ